MAEDTLELVRLRNNFYRDNYRRAMIVLLCSMVINFCLGAGVYYLYFSKPQPIYFATNENGSLLQMIPLDQPYVDDDQLLRWAVEACTAAYSFNFLDYRNNLQQARKYFTEAGFASYVQALERSGNLATVETKRLVVKAYLTDNPVIISRGKLGGQERYVWQVEVPMVVRYVSAGTEIKQPVLIKLLIGRVSTLDSVSGVAIAQFVVEDRK